MMLAQHSYALGTLIGGGLAVVLVTSLVIAFVRICLRSLDATNGINPEDKPKK